ncbi:hypothetical protein E6W39_23800 [Kitasatospora acidiphila]|uniref:Uncharacterized protein n=1 Tax=Kitasatospora acidiphila TaxID=2567942 RepID=A0A540W6P4_9ACTN|nr:hypothetical protein [Kitasatospora acidiphila]TQF04692.1 hypothetical protein E6W39_23800 [Kitasatospora acidiphila]
MTNTQKISMGFQPNRQLIGAGMVLGAVGAAAATVGTIMIFSALAAAGRSWLRQLETAPAERASRALTQAKAASQAGLDAWRSAAASN